MANPQPELRPQRQPGPRPSPGSQLAQVLSSLEEAPGTSGEIAAVTGLPMKHCSEYLRVLLARGFATRKPIAGSAGRAFLYSLASQSSSA